MGSFAPAAGPYILALTPVPARFEHHGETRVKTPFCPS